MCIHLEGDPLKKAIAWISEQRKHKSSLNTNVNVLIEKACIRFDLTPKDEAFLYRTIVE